MQYKLKNITSEIFDFEGVMIPPNEISEELVPETYQRLLAIYYGTTLLPVEDPSYMNTPPEKDKVEEKDIKKDEEDKKEKVEEKDIKEDKKDEEKEKLPQFICDKCKKEFKSNRALLAHKRFAHKEVGK